MAIEMLSTCAFGGAMEIVGSTRTDVFVIRTVGNDPDKVSLSFSGFPTKPNHQFTQNSGRGGSMSAGGHSAKSATGRRTPGGDFAKKRNGPLVLSLIHI